MLSLKEFLKSEFKIALGCTEPAAVAYAAATAASQLSGGDVLAVQLRCDPRIYKNCYAVGIPNSEGKTGVLWSVALGSLLPNADKLLESFSLINKEILQKAEKLTSSNSVEVLVDKNKRELYIECKVIKTTGVSRVVLEGTHTNIVLIEVGGELKFQKDKAKSESKSNENIRAQLMGLSIEQLIQIVSSIDDEDIEFINKAIEMNMKISEYGISLLEKSIQHKLYGIDGEFSNISFKVCGGVYARMSGIEMPVMSLAGSGNKGITVCVPLYMWGKEKKFSDQEIAKSIAVAAVFTSYATNLLGTLSAACGCANAAGVGLAAGLVYLEHGDTLKVSKAINNMVGNISGMICDGAKMGCSLKVMSSVDAAFRSKTLAMNGVGIPPTDGIVAEKGEQSLEYLGRIAHRAMNAVDDEILKIMQEKMRK